MKISKQKKDLLDQLCTDPVLVVTVTSYSNFFFENDKTLSETEFGQ
jgi:hypothetical protein